MLVLQLKLGEAFVIGEGPTAFVVEVVEFRNMYGPKVRLGITGPREVPIDRMVIYKEKHGGPPPAVKGAH